MSIGVKLRLTQRVLACRSLKELAVRFRQVNPDTTFEVERARKWIGGAATPRNPRLYDDWAAVIGSSRPGSWIAAASPRAFAEELAAALDADLTRLEAALAEFAPRPPAPPPALDPASGIYITYSRAYSRYYSGWLVRGLLELSAQPDGHFALAYRERFLEKGEVTVRGAARLSDDLLACHATPDGDAFTDAPFLFLLRTPGHPPHILFGQMLTVAVFGPEREPGASEFVAIRVDEATAKTAEGAICYLEATAESLATEVRRLGFDGEAAETLTGTLTELFGPTGAPLTLSPFRKVAGACAALVRAEGGGKGRKTVSTIDLSLKNVINN